VSPTSTSAPSWRQPTWLNDPATGPLERTDSRGSWAERTWGRAGGWLGSLERSVLNHLPWRSHPAVFGEKTFKAMVAIRDAAQTLVNRFAEDQSITVAQVIDTIDQYVEIWARAVHEAKVAGRFRGKTVRVLTWCS
jgi:hypothetical protein